MSKAKSGEQPHYELLYLISNKFSEDEVKPIMEKVNALVTANGGEISLSEELGKKRLAYPIKGFRFGYYNLVEFDMMGENLAKLDRALRLMNEILRQQIVVKVLRTAQQIARDKKIAEKIAAKNVAAEKTAKEKVKERAKEKVDLKDLDEKLDKILETDDLL
ncbi:30S ribosomal protein S6 [Candidatus Falkowbacteria bacterium]|nr:30S ribosomal protein S6 [Candidatus Falkowbacteria bacterium]OIP80957.1 MAG: 30S ribosomal protein S6 [Parcubacteria group bacterium CG2_30_45_37]